MNLPELKDGPEEDEEIFKGEGVERADNFDGDSRIYFNNYQGQELLTKKEVLLQISVWINAIMMHECK